MTPGKIRGEVMKDYKFTESEIALLYRNTFQLLDLAEGYLRKIERDKELRRNLIGLGVVITTARNDQKEYVESLKHLSKKLRRFKYRQGKVTT